MHNRGAGTLLLEHLVSLARGREVRAFTAQTLTQNALMLQAVMPEVAPAEGSTGRHSPAGAGDGTRRR